MIDSIIAFFTESAYQKAVTLAETLEKQGKPIEAAEAYMALLETEYARKMKLCGRIVRLTDGIQPLLERLGRTKDERRVLRQSMRLCITTTRTRSWERWQKRITELDHED